VIYLLHLPQFNDSPSMPAWAFMLFAAFPSQFAFLEDDHFDFAELKFVLAASKWWLGLLIHSRMFSS
jgi:hypothetical protein